MKEPRPTFGGQSITYQSLHHHLSSSEITYLIRLDVRGNYTYVNQAFEQAYGPRERFVGKHYLSSVHPDDTTVCKQAVQELMKYSEEKTAFEIRKPKRDGTYYPSRWEFSALMDEQGNVVGTQGIGYDIYEQRAAEEQNAILLQKSYRLNQELQATQESLIRSEKKFRSLIEHSFDAIIVYDQEGIITYASPSVEGVIGYTPEELISTSGCTYMSPADASNAFHLLDDSLAHPEVRVTGEMRLARKDGRVIWVESVLTNFIHDEDVRGVISNFRDITGQRQGKQAIAEYSKRLELATQSANIGIWDWYIPENRLMWDTRASKILGIDLTYSAFYRQSMAEAIETWLEIIHPDDKERVRDGMEEALRGAESFSIEYRVVRPDNHEVRHVKIYAKILREESVAKDSNLASPIRMTGAIRDTTNINTTEQQLRNNIDALQKTNAELDQFVYSTSHNLRSPLASVLGLVAVLRDESDPAEQARYLELVETSIHRLDRTIHSILDYSRNARVVLSIGPIDFKKLIDEITDDLHFSTGAVALGVNIRLTDSSTFASDSSRLRMIIGNLLSNAIKYYNPRVAQPRATITVEAAKRGVVIRVEDNGIGIPNEKQDEVFKMFYRASQQAFGSGLGLYIVKEAATRLGGTVSLTSRVGEGTVLSVYLPSLADQLEDS
jgi:PAS domain S-box-containing protein